MGVANPAPTLSASDNEAISSSDASEQVDQSSAHQDAASTPSELFKPDVIKPRVSPDHAPRRQLDDHQDTAQPSGVASKAEMLEKGLELAADGVTSQPPQTEAPQPPPSIAEASLTAQLQVKAAQAELSEPERLANDWIQLHLMPTINRQVSFSSVMLPCMQQEPLTCPASLGNHACSLEMLPWPANMLDWPAIYIKGQKRMPVAQFHIDLCQSALSAACQKTRSVADDNALHVTSHTESAMLLSLTLDRCRLGAEMIIVPDFLLEADRLHDEPCHSPSFLCS